MTAPFDDRDREVHGFPTSVAWAGGLMFLAGFLGLIGLVLLAQSSEDADDTAVVTTLGLVLGVTMILTLAMCAGRNWARLTLIGLNVLNLLAGGTGALALAAALAIQATPEAAGIGALILGQPAALLVATILLFTRSTKAHMARCAAERSSRRHR